MVVRSRPFGKKLILHRDGESSRRTPSIVPSISIALHSILFGWLVHKMRGLVLTTKKKVVRKKIMVYLTDADLLPGGKVGANGASVLRVFGFVSIVVVVAFAVTPVYTVFPLYHTAIRTFSSLPLAFYCQPQPVGSIHHALPPRSATTIAHNISSKRSSLIISLLFIFEYFVILAYLAHNYLVRKFRARSG